MNKRNKFLKKMKKNIKIQNKKVTKIRVNSKMKNKESSKWLSKKKKMNTTKILMRKNLFHSEYFLSMYIIKYYQEGNQGDEEDLSEIEDGNLVV